MNRLLVFFLVFLSPLAALSQVCDPSNSDVCSVSPQKFLPAAIDPNHLNKPPEYPAMSRRLGEEGIIILKVIVESDGSVVSPEVRMSSGFQRLDQSALLAIKQWKFLPAKLDEIPIRKEYEQKIAFWLNYSWAKLDQENVDVEIFVRSNIVEQSDPVKDGGKILVLFNFKQREVPEVGRKTKYSHGMSVLAVREMRCSSKQFRDISTSAWSEHWAKGDLAGLATAGEWRDMKFFSAFCERKEKQK